MFNIICKKIKKLKNIKPKHFLILKEHSTGESNELYRLRTCAAAATVINPVGVPRLISKVPSRVCVYRKCGSCKLFLFVIFLILFSSYYPLRKNLIKTHKEIHANNLNSHSFCRDILVRLTAKYHLFDDF